MTCFIHHDLGCVFCADSVEYSIAADKDEVEIIIYWHGENFWICDDAVRVTSILFHLGDAVTECPRHLHEEETIEDEKNWNLPKVCLEVRAPGQEWGVPLVDSLHSHYSDKLCLQLE